MQAFGDGFDLYAATGDALASYWDSGNSAHFTLVSGRFAGSRAASFGAASSGAIPDAFVKASGSNDGLHHFVLAIQQTAALSGTTLGCSIQLIDGATNQCCVVFRSDGAMLLTSGAPTGTVLATYTGAITAANTWIAFEIEVVVHNTAGSITVRRNGNTGTADFTLGSLNTRTSANNYANKIALGNYALVNAHQVDDFLWRSDASSVPWVGDIRCYTRMPISDASVQFSRSSAGATGNFFETTSTVSNSSLSVGTTYFFPVTLTQGGMVSALLANFNASATGHANAALYDNSGTGGSPGKLLGQATSALTNPASGLRTWTVSTPFGAPKGTVYVAIMADVAIGITGSIGQTYYSAGSQTYSTSFPAQAPTTSSATFNANYVGLTISAITNAGLVNEAQQDATTSYVYDSTVNDADFYNIQSLPVTPANVVAVTTRGFLEKSDAGTRSAAVQLKSGGTTVQSAAPALGTAWGWRYRTDAVDPATGAAWAPTAVDAAQIGSVVTA